MMNIADRNTERLFRKKRKNEIRIEDYKRIIISTIHP